MIEEIRTLYPEFIYPNEFQIIKKLNLIDFGIWYIMPENQVFERTKGLIERYPGRKLIPFARRDDCDDIACFDLEKNYQIQIIHDFSSSGFEQRETYFNFWDWFKNVINTMISSAVQGELDF